MCAHYLQTYYCIELLLLVSSLVNSCIVVMLILKALRRQLLLLFSGDQFCQKIIHSMRVIWFPTWELKHQLRILSFNTSIFFWTLTSHRNICICIRGTTSESTMYISLIQLVWRPTYICNTNYVYSTLRCCLVELYIIVWGTTVISDLPIFT